MNANGIAKDIARLAKQLQQASNEFNRGEILLASTLAQDVAWELERLFRLMIFFWDPKQPHPNDVDVKALLRIAVVYNIPIACNRSTADFIISSPLMGDQYEPVLKDYSKYIERELDGKWSRL